MQLKNIFGEVLWEGEANSARDAFDKAIHWCTNLHGADMHGMNLRDADMRRANLRDADMRRANLCGADLSRAILNGADLSDANLCGANLSDANLTGIRDDFEIVLKAAHAEAPALLAALREGRVDGTQSGFGHHRRMG